MLSIIAGKPGSGKSYHVAMLVVDMLSDWVRYELRKGMAYNSSIWTNMKFELDGLNATVGSRVGKEADVSGYMNYCDSDFFNDPDCTYWWNKFPAQSVIIIDEVHFHLGKKVEYGSLDLEQELINWVSIHRHSQQQIYFISQHTDQFANQILGVADKLLEIVNVKSLELPWPISIPMSDVDELKRSFGITTQYYQANVGNFRGKAIKWSGAAQRNMMSSDIYRVYRSASHGSVSESLDRPSLEMQWWEGLLWFSRRHMWHLLPKMGLIVSIPFLFLWLTFSLPDLFAASVVGGTKLEQKDDRKEERAESAVAGKSELPSIPSVGVVSSSASRTPVLDKGSVGEVGRSVAGGVGLGKEVNELSAATQSVPAAPKVESKRVLKIVMLYQEGVMLDDGKKIAIGETFEVDGSPETLSCACPVCGVIVFKSGKRIRF